MRRIGQASGRSEYFGAEWMFDSVADDREDFRLSRSPLGR